MCASLGQIVDHSLSPLKKKKENKICSRYSQDAGIELYIAVFHRSQENNN